MWPKKPNFIWPFFKNKKRPKELKKGQKLKFGLKKAKLATLVVTARPPTRLAQVRSSLLCLQRRNLLANCCTPGL